MPAEFQSPTRSIGLENALLTRIRLRQLSSFVLVYELKNIMKASRQLALTQSTVSKSITEMETSLGQKLFTRSPRGVAPTPAGDVIYHHAKIILGELRHAADDLERISAADRGQVVVGVVPTAMAVLGKALALFKLERPGVAVRVIYGPDEDLMSQLSIGEVDFVFGRLYDENRRTGLTHEPVYDDPAVIIVRNDHPARNLRRPKLGDLLDYPWILPQPNAYIRRYHDLAFLNQGLPLPANVVETVSINIYRSLLLTTPELVTILSEHAFDLELEGGRLVTLPTDTRIGLNPVGFTTRTDAILHPPADAFREAIRRAAPAG